MVKLGELFKVGNKAYAVVPHTVLGVEVVALIEIDELDNVAVKATFFSTELALTAATKLFKGMK